jgi:hypothetical protein
MELSEFVALLARGIKLADDKQPVALNSRSGCAFQPGIGPHSEAATIDLALAAIETDADDAIACAREVPYPSSPRTRCDICIGSPYEWAIEVKMLRLMGDKGKPNDNMLMHILSPYPAHRSALTDCAKLLTSGFECRKAIVILGYDYPEWPMDPAINSFAVLAADAVHVAPSDPAGFDTLVHPIHSRGRVFGWELLGGPSLDG